MPQMSSRPYAVVLAGGGGTRLWPLSSPNRPKPFLPLLHGRSPLAVTLERLAPLVSIDDTYIVVAASQVQLVRECAPQIAADHILAEPVSRNTGAAVALAVATIDRPDDAVMLVIPADHAVRDADAWRVALAAAADHAGHEANALYTLGVVPTRPETGFGYIVADGERVTRFTEKPQRDEAERLIAAGARWNAGTFAWRRDSARRARAIRTNADQRHRRVQHSASGTNRHVRDGARRRGRTRAHPSARLRLERHRLVG